MKVNKDRQLVRKKYYLKDNLLYCYRKGEDYPSEMIFMLGCFIEPIQEISRYGFIISHDYKSPLKLFGLSRDDRDDWIKALTEASHTIQIDDDYTFHMVIGTGKFSNVYRAIHKQTYESVAIKVIEKATLDEQETEFLGTELAIIKVIEHPYITEVIDVYEDAKKIYIVMEIIDGGELFEYVVKNMVLSESEAALIGYQILSTLGYMHEASVVHRDLKPENILIELDEKTGFVKGIRITDFGLSKMMNPNKKYNEMCGTLAYVAPEVLNQEGYNKEVDYWSAGVIIYLLLCGQLPFDSDSKTEIFQKTL